MGRYSAIITAFIFATALSSCREPAQPRPHGYFRIDLPEKKYMLYESPCPFTFEYPVYATISPGDENDAEPCWINIEFPQYRSKIHLSYKKVNNNLPKLLEDTYTLTYNHTIKADAISETPFVNSDEQVFGVLYDLRGNTATSLQFYLTDSINHFLRGSLYFHSSPNVDSLAPVISFFREDILKLIETTRWKSSK